MNNFSAVIPEPKIIKSEDLEKKTKKFLEKLHAQQTPKEIDFQNKVADHKRQHPCCPYPEVCVSERRAHLFFLK